MKKQLLKFSIALAATLFLTSGLFAQHTAPVRVEYLPYAVPRDIIIDGIADEDGWSPNSPLTEIFNSTGVENPVDFSGYIKFCYDRDNLYVFADIIDVTATIYEGTDDPLIYDNVEVFLNADTSLLDSGAYGDDAIQLRYNRGVDTATGSKPRNGADLSNFVVAESGYSWQVEAAIPWISFLPEGTLPEDIWTILQSNCSFGFDVSFADNDGAGRDGQLAWDADTEGNDTTEDNAWNNTTMFGILNFGYGCEISLENTTDPASDFGIYPNPASNDVNFTNLSGVKALEIVNLIGQTLKRIEISAEESVVDISDLSSGAYIVQLFTDQGILTTQKFVVKK